MGEEIRKALDALERQAMVPLWPDAALVLNVGKAAAYQAAKEGTFPGAVRIGGQWRVSSAKLRGLIGGANTSELPRAA